MPPRPARLNAALPALLFAALPAVLPAQTAAPPNERTETWPDGTLKRRWTVDDEGRRHGRLEEFAGNGTRVLFAVYAHDRREGDWREWDEEGRKVRFLTYQNDALHGHAEVFRPDGSTASAGDYQRGLRHGKWVEIDGDRHRTAEYRAGQLHGALRVQQKDKVLTRQVWKDGELQQLDDLQPFPVPRSQLLAELRATLQQAPPPQDPKDPLAGQRAAALRRLQLYRHLCGLPWQDLALVPDWNLRCDAAAETCRRLGRLDHHPPKPDDMDPARWQLGVDGAGHSNLAIAGSLAGSVDSYMDDSDAGNIDRVGHRRWCLNPAMRKTGFGTDGQFHAMWSMDGSGNAPKGLANVFYPPRGYVPVDLFSPHRAFSIALLRGGEPKKEALAARVRPLDVDYLPQGDPLALDWCDLAGGGYGGASCLVFRPTGLLVEAGQRYLVEVSTDGGKTQAYRYVVEFCAPVIETEPAAK